VGGKRGRQYDAAGNLIGDGTTSYAYDALNRLIARGTTTYTYNGDGALVYDGATRYTQDLVSPLSQILQTTQGLTTTDYLYGANRLASVAGSTRTWYLGDALGSVRQTLSDSGTVLGSVNYDPWGTVESGTVPTFGFTGELQDSAAGLVNLRARWYSTAQGRFGSRDSFAGFNTHPTSLHPYLYVANNPVNLTDASGKCFPPIEVLRELEPLNCSNLLAAGQIFWNPNAYWWERGEALAYVTVWTGGHVCAIVGAGILTVEAGTALSSGAALARLSAAVEAAPAVLRWIQQALGSTAPNLPGPAQRTIDWLEDQPLRVSHIMAEEHAWERLGNLSGDMLQDYRAIQPYLAQVMSTTGRHFTTTDQGEQVLQFVATIKGEQVLVRATQLANDVLRITNAWVVTVTR
jgi:RHS repeat-associated protein